MVPGWVDMYIDTDAVPIFFLNEYVLKIINSVAQKIKEEYDIWLEDTIPLLIGEKLQAMPDAIENIIIDILFAIDEHSPEEKKGLLEFVRENHEFSNYDEILSTFANETTKQIELLVGRPILVPFPGWLNVPVMLPKIYTASLLKTKLTHTIQEKLQNRTYINKIEEVVKVQIITLVDMLKERMIYDINKELDTLR
jgi:sensor c-di-GMP phosphodiesterase-like protein